MDLALIWRGPCESFIPDAAICLDPFHVIRLANQALDSVYQRMRRLHGRAITNREWRRTRYALRAGAEKLSDEHRRLLFEVRQTRYELWCAWELKEELRDLYRIVDPRDARDHLVEWLAAALASELRPFVNLARQLERHFEGIVAAVERGLSNSRLEGINSKIRLINRRGFGHPNAESLAAMIHLCLGGITIPLPTET